MIMMMMGRLHCISDGVWELKALREAEFSKGVVFSSHSFSFCIKTLHYYLRSNECISFRRQCKFSGAGLLSDPNPGSASTHPAVYFSYSHQAHYQLIIKAASIIAGEIAFSSSVQSGFWVFQAECTLHLGYDNLTVFLRRTIRRLPSGETCIYISLLKDLLNSQPNSHSPAL